MGMAQSLLGVSLKFVGEQRKAMLTLNLGHFFRKRRKWFEDILRVEASTGVRQKKRCHRSVNRKSGFTGGF